MILLQFTLLIWACFCRFSLASFQFSSVAQSCPTLWNPINCSTPGLPVHHQLLKFTQTHVHRVSDTIQPSHPLLSHSPQSFPESGSFPMSRLITSGSQSIGALTSAQSPELLLSNGFKNDWKYLPHFFTLKAMEILANWNSGARIQVSPKHHNFIYFYFVLGYSPLAMLW